MELLAFDVAGTACALELGRVREIRVDDPLTPVPLAAPALRGLVNVRGQVVPVVDLCVRLGAAAQARPDGALVLVHVRDGGAASACAVLVDAILGIEETERILPPPQPPLSPADAVRGIAPLERGLTLVLDPDALLDPAAVQAALAPHASARGTTRGPRTAAGARPGGPGDAATASSPPTLASARSEHRDARHPEVEGRPPTPTPASFGPEQARHPELEGRPPTPAPASVRPEHRGARRPELEGRPPTPAPASMGPEQARHPELEGRPPTPTEGVEVTGPRPHHPDGELGHADWTGPPLRGVDRHSSSTGAVRVGTPAAARVVSRAVVAPPSTSTPPVTAAAPAAGVATTSSRSPSRVRVAAAGISVVGVLVVVGIVLARSSPAVTARGAPPPTPAPVSFRPERTGEQRPEVEGPPPAPAPASFRPERTGEQRPEVEGPPPTPAPASVRPERRGAQRPEVEGRPPPPIPAAAAPDPTPARSHAFRPAGLDAATRPPAPDPASTVVVRAGDTLWALSGRLRGDPRRWPVLYRANRDGVRDPDLLHPGQRLHVPPRAP